MIDIKYMIDAEGYVNNFAVTGDLPNGLFATVAVFDMLNYDCYKAINGNLVWDEDRYQKKINPTPVDTQQTQEDFLLDLELRLTLLELGL
ncbi:hypothetical protein [Bacillus ndiopicus]|uniref:hypothetical protein n=1 Tax=Bacillus ndiopicus TaxID=1347368 RepID=UPI000AB6D042|nr:hypothetical protein [Bacillus ndiopicus]